MFIAPIPRPRGDADSPVGRKAGISTWQRISDNDLPPRIKAGANYLNSRYAFLEARRHGYDLPILLGRNGKVTEGSGASLFMLRRGALTTPPPTSSQLESITQSTLMDLAREAGLQLAVREIDRTELYIADEIFLWRSGGGDHSHHLVGRVRHRGRPSGAQDDIFMANLPGGRQ